MACECVSSDIKTGLPGGRRRQRRSEETANRIYREALRCFAEKGFNSCTTEDITTRAGVAKGTFFVYFPRKEDVLLQLLSLIAEEYKVVARVSRVGDSGIHDHVLKLFCQPARSANLNPQLLANLLYVLIGTDGGRRAASRLITNSHLYLAKLCSRAKISAELRVELLDDRFAEEFLMAFTGALFHWALYPAGELEQQLTSRFELFWESVKRVPRSI